MAFVIRPTKDSEKAIKRVVDSQIKKAIQDLRDGYPSDPEAIHNARKRFKKIRAVIRLVRDELGSQYKKENASYREMGRRLSEARDAEAMLEAYQALSAHFSHIDFAPFLPVYEHFQRAREQVISNEQEVARSVERVLGELHSARSRLDQWKIASRGFDAFGDGLAEIYDKGKKSFKVAVKEPCAETFHEFRKQVKYYWYHMRLLYRAWPEMLGPFIDELKALADDLGDDHDLAVMTQQIRQAQDQSFDEVWNEFYLLVQSRQKQLRKSAKLRGKRVYAEKADCVQNRLAKWWEVASK